jgi:preprotein translocase subunit SecB
MATTNGGPGTNAVMPSINVLAQYIKDMSFENPNAPNSLGAMAQSPSVNIKFNVNAKPLSNTDFEVELIVEGKAEHEQKVMFGVELVYSGIFRIMNVPPEVLQQVVLIECPRILFPFARQIVSDVIRNGGFPPLMIDPVDFAGLYRERFGQGQPQAAAAPQ